MRSPGYRYAHPGYAAPYSAACLTCRAVGVRIVTSSSAAVGCSAMVASKSALVAFIFTAMATAWTISAARVADDVTAEHAIGGAVDHELHQHAGVAAGHRRLDRAEIGLVDVDVAELRARFGFGQADGADFGLREHRGRDGGVIDLDRALAEHGVGEGMALADRHRRQVDAMGDVADRIDVVDRGLRPAVDGDAAIARVDGDAGLLEPEIGDVRDAGRSRTSPSRRRCSNRSTDAW